MCKSISNWNSNTAAVYKFSLFTLLASFNGFNYKWPASVVFGWETIETHILLFCVKPLESKKICLIVKLVGNLTRVSIVCTCINM